MDTTILKLIETKNRNGNTIAQCVMSISQLAMLYKVHIYKSDGRVSKDAGYQRQLKKKELKNLLVL